MKAFALPKSERISGRQALLDLLEKGKGGTAGCLRFKAAPSCVDGDSAVSRIMVSVPKKQFKRAVKRNLLKRRMREAYRLRKSMLQFPVDILFVYIGREVLPYETIYNDMSEALERIAAMRDEQNA